MRYYGVKAPTLFGFDMRSFGDNHYILILFLEHFRTRDMS